MGLGRSEETRRVLPFEIFHKLPLSNASARVFFSASPQGYVCLYRVVQMSRIALSRGRFMLNP